MKIARIDRGAAALVSAFVMPVFFFAPLRVFLNNTADFTVGLSHVLLALLLVSTTLLAVFYVAGTLWPRVLLPAVTFLSIVAFLEFTIFLDLARHAPFDGRPIDWAPLGTLANFELIVMTVVGLLVVVFRRHSEIWRSVSLSILLFHLLGLGHAVFTRPAALPQHQSNFQNKAYFADFYHLSRQRNVIHIVPDQTQGAMVYDIVHRPEAILEDLTASLSSLRRWAAQYYPSVLPTLGLSRIRGTMFFHKHSAGTSRSNLTERRSSRRWQKWLQDIRLSIQPNLLCCALRACGWETCSEGCRSRAAEPRHNLGFRDVAIQATPIARASTVTAVALTGRRAA